MVSCSDDERRSSRSTRLADFFEHGLVEPGLGDHDAAGLDIELGSLDDVIERADVMSLHVPLTETTAGLIGAARIARMKQGAVVVYAARKVDPLNKPPSARPPKTSASTSVWASRFRST